MTDLKVGDKAPDFNINDEKGNLVSLGDFKGKKLILFFYPKASTPGCTAEACNLNDNYSLLGEKGFAILGASADDEKKQTKFKEKYNFKYPLLADTEKVLLNAYGVWGLKKMYGREYEGIFRTTFVISEDGIIEQIYTKVKTKEHAEQILKDY